MKTTLPELLRTRQTEIAAWARGLTHERMGSAGFGGWQNGLILNPLMVRDDLLTPDVRDVFINPAVRQVVYIDLHPHSGIPWHNHRDASYYMMDSRGEMIEFPFTGPRYKTTHFAVEIPDEREKAFMFIDGRKHFWEYGRFEEFDVIDSDHYARNDTAQHLKIIYIDYYPEAFSLPAAPGGK
ncbi:MAG: hypothetical protein ACOY3X_02410 [Pseudomonadota bacterium]